MKIKYTLSTIFIIILLLITGCTFGNKRTFNYLMDEYVKGYMEADSKLVKDVFPQYYVEYAKSILSKKYLKNELEKNKKKYGDDFKITYEITKSSKMNDEELESLNKQMETFFNVVDKATECYKFEGTILYKGSKKEEKNSMSTIGYCKYDNVWYLVRK